MYLRPSVVRGLKESEEAYIYVPETYIYVPEVPTRGGEGVERVPVGSRALLAPAPPDVSSCVIQSELVERCLLLLHLMYLRHVMLLLSPHMQV